MSGARAWSLCSTQLSWYQPPISPAHPTQGVSTSESIHPSYFLQTTYRKTTRKQYPNKVCDTAAAKSLSRAPLCATQDGSHLAPRPWGSPGKNTGVGCHCLLQCRKVKSESEVAQSCRLLATPWTAAYQAPLSMGFSRQEYWSGLPLPSPLFSLTLN